MAHGSLAVAAGLIRLAAAMTDSSI